MIARLTLGRKSTTTHATSSGASSTHMKPGAVASSAAPAAAAAAAGSTAWRGQGSHAASRAPGAAPPVTGHRQRKAVESSRLARSMGRLLAAHQCRNATSTSGAGKLPRSAYASMRQRCAAASGWRGAGAAGSERDSTSSHVAGGAAPGTRLALADGGAFLGLSASSWCAAAAAAAAGAAAAAAWAARAAAAGRRVKPSARSSSPAAASAAASAAAGLAAWPPLSPELPDPPPPCRRATCCWYGGGGGCRRPWPPAPAPWLCTCRDRWYCALESIPRPPKPPPDAPSWCPADMACRTTPTLPPALDATSSNRGCAERVAQKAAWPSTSTGLLRAAGAGGRLEAASEAAPPECGCGCVRPEEEEEDDAPAAGGAAAAAVRPSSPALPPPSASPAVRSRGADAVCARRGRWACTSKQGEQT